jgi:RsiW-degrading membrane proteinase PrsW (M82 family)
VRDRLRAFYYYLCAWIPNADARALLAQAVVVLGIAAAIGVALHRRIPSTPAWARANALARAGDFEGAERAYWEFVTRGPVTMPLLVDFLDNHEHLKLFAELPDEATRSLKIRRQHVVVQDAEIEKLLDGAPREISLLGSYWWHTRKHDVDEELRREVVAAADAEPPMPWANHLLAAEAQLEAKLAEQAMRLEREGLAFPERKNDAREALRIWLAQKDWDTLENKLADPRYQGVADPWVRHEYALHVGDWKSAARWMVAAYLDDMNWAHLGLAATTALMWGLFCARLGKLRDRPLFRGSLYVVAFALGVVSVVPTLALITVEEHFLDIRQSGDMIRDAVFFVGGVGFREEFCKLLLFVPLLPILRRFGTRLDVLACGAMVGLGFAAEENLMYFERGDESVALGRFLTANFMHVSMTAICAGALDDWVGSPGDRSFDFSKAFLLVVVLHGAYDFFATYAGFFSMAIFILLTRQFLNVVSMARGRPDKHDKFLRRFVQAVIVVLGASFAYACARVGPGAAAAILAAGLLGDAIILYMFIQEMRHAG